ncbi:TPA: hypothetical protein ACGU2D_003274 [Vibrio vulnificus]
MNRSGEVKHKERETLICNSMQSFSDMCDNYLVIDKNVHCTFKVSEWDKTWMCDYLYSKGGLKLSVYSGGLFIERKVTVPNL